MLSLFPSSTKSEHDKMECSVYTSIRLVRRKGGRERERKGGGGGVKSERRRHRERVGGGSKHWTDKMWRGNQEKYNRPKSGVLHPTLNCCHGDRLFQGQSKCATATPNKQGWKRRHSQSVSAWIDRNWNGVERKRAHKWGGQNSEDEWTREDKGG